MFQPKKVNSPCKKSKLFIISIITHVSVVKIIRYFCCLDEYSSQNKERTKKIENSRRCQHLPIDHGRLLEDQSILAIDLLLHQVVSVEHGRHLQDEVDHLRHGTNLFLRRPFLTSPVFLPSKMVSHCQKKRCTAHEPVDLLTRRLRDN
jgi:hypothetical protein